MSYEPKKFSYLKMDLQKGNISLSFTRHEGGRHWYTHVKIFIRRVTSRFETVDISEI